MARHTAFCAHVSKTSLTELRALSSQMNVAKGTLLFEQERPMTKVYFLTEGMVKIFHLLPDGQRQVTGFMVPGDILGGIKRQASAHCSAEAVTDVSLCTFERDGFLRIIQDYPDLCFKLLITATDEIEAQHEHMTLLGRKRAVERLAIFLLMADTWRLETGTPGLLHLPMTRADIADYLGLTVESMSRTFSRLKTMGYIALSGPNNVRLLNLAGLYDLAGLDHLPERQVALGL